LCGVIRREKLQYGKETGIVGKTMPVLLRLED
jgi:hypothetical protein